MFLYNIDGLRIATTRLYKVCRNDWELPKRKNYGRVVLDMHIHRIFDAAVHQLRSVPLGVPYEKVGFRTNTSIWVRIIPLHLQDGLVATTSAGTLEEILLRLDMNL